MGDKGRARANPRRRTRGAYTITGRAGGEVKSTELVDREVEKVEGERGSDRHGMQRRLPAHGRQDATSQDDTKALGNLGSHLWGAGY